MEVHCILSALSELVASADWPLDLTINLNEGNKVQNHTRMDGGHGDDM